jgi:hypothetical protein
VVAGFDGGGERHAANLYAKLGAGGRREALRLAAELGLVPLG